MAKLTPDQMTAVKAIAPFELALIFEEWQRRTEDGNDKTPRLDDCGGLGPTFALNGETLKSYGERMAAGIITLLKEV